MGDDVKITPAEWATLSPHVWSLLGSLVGCVGRPTRAKIRAILRETEDLTRAIRAVV